MAPSPPPPDDDSSTSPASPLAGVRAILYDQFGTLTDWESSVSGQLAAQAEQGDQGGVLSDSSGGAGSVAGAAGRQADSRIVSYADLKSLDWLDFTRKWRNGYMVRT